MKQFKLKSKPGADQRVIFTRVSAGMKAKLALVCASTGVSQNDFTTQALKHALEAANGNGVRRSSTSRDSKENPKKGRNKLWRVSGHRRLSS